MDDWKKKILRREGYKLFRQLDLEPELRGCLYSRYLITDHQYQQLQALYDRGEKVKAAEMCLMTCIQWAGRVDDKCPFESFVSALEEIVDSGGSSSNGEVAKHLRKAVSAVVESGPSSGFAHRSQSLDLVRCGYAVSSAANRRACSEPDIPRTADCRAMCAMLVLGDMFCAPDLLKHYSAGLGWEDQLFIDRETHLDTPYSYVTLVKDIVLYGRVQVRLIGCKATADNISSVQPLQKVLQTVTKPLGGVILLVDICQNVDTVISEVTRLKQVLSLVNLSQVRSVLVPSSTPNAMDVGSHSVPDHELQERIRHHAIGLGIRDFHCNLSDAITDIISHYINESFTPDFKESCTTAGSSSQAALRPRHRKSHSTTSFPGSHKVEEHYLHSVSVSDTESKSSGGSESFTHSTSSFSPGMKIIRCNSSAHSVCSLPTIPQSPPEHPIPFDGCSSAETMSLDCAESFQPNARTADNGHSLPFPTDCLDNVESVPMLPLAEPVSASARFCSSTRSDRVRGDSNCQQNPFYTAILASDMDDALIISVSEENKKRMIESAPAIMGSPSEVSGNTSGAQACPPQHRRCSIL